MTIAPISVLQIKSRPVSSAIERRQLLWALVFGKHNKIIRLEDVTATKKDLNRISFLTVAKERETYENSKLCAAPWQRWSLPPSRLLSNNSVRLLSRMKDAEIQGAGRKAKFTIQLTSFFEGEEALSV